MAQYWTCSCGLNLNHGEKCDCGGIIAAPQKKHIIKPPKKKVERCSSEEVSAITSSLFRKYEVEAAMRALNN